ncbi:GNAT family N-acetyltransferase [Actinospica robiniae]|uniref:GNAT family N-acetyltransferase n=1 Tax=Actinospica robiniae TaxID=304901 RepID=UPI000688750C
MAEAWLLSFSAALPTVRRAHTDDQVRQWMRDVVIPEFDAFVAVDAGVVVGLLVLGEHAIEQLYLHPSWRGRGLGDRLVELAKSRLPHGLELWTFQVNESAMRFYARHGLVEMERTDGSANEEREPDVRFVWRP